MAILGDFGGRRNPAQTPDPDQWQGDDEARQCWDKLRQLPEAASLGLIYEQDGASQARPCGELLLSERGARRIRDLGPSPLVSVRDRDTIRLPAMISVAGEPLAGTWKP